MASLINDAQRELLLQNNATVAAGAAGGLLPVVKLYTPDAHATWLLVSLDPSDGNTAFGLCDLGIGAPRLDHIKLSDLASIRGPRDLLVCCDAHFVARRSLAAYLRQAEADGSITD